MKMKRALDGLVSVNVCLVFFFFCRSFEFLFRFDYFLETYHDDAAMRGAVSDTSGDDDMILPRPTRAKSVDELPPSSLQECFEIGTSPGEGEICINLVWQRLGSGLTRKRKYTHRATPFSVSEVESRSDRKNRDFPS